MPAPKASKHAKKVEIKKYIHKAPKDHQMKREKNRHHYEGFYERMKKLDVKQGHSMEGFMQFDALMDFRDQDAMDDQLQSNFIAFLRTERMNNRTLDFRKVFDEIEPLAYSHALIVLNKNQIISKLLGYFRSDLPDKQQSAALQTNDNVVRGKVLELLIALIKDLRQDSYLDFKEQIMPAVISIIDIQNIAIMDKVFTLFSFCFKYLLKPIREDLTSFYGIFQELVIHKNRHLRHFAAQCLSYVLRKVDLNPHTLRVVLQPIYRTVSDDGSELGPFQVVHLLQGISDVLFEVMYGASEELHSKAVPVLSVLLDLSPEDPEADPDQRLVKTIRLLMIKLFNSIDTSKQHPLLEKVHKHLLVAPADKGLSEARVSLAMSVFQDCLKLKLGRRVSHISVLQMFDSLSLLMNKKQGEQVRASFGAATLGSIAATLSYLYYFKHQSIMQIFQQSQLDLSNSKSVFTHHVYKCCPGHLPAFFALFLSGPKNIIASPIGLGPDLDFGTILGIKSSNASQIEFTSESHAFKFKLLLPSLLSYTASRCKSSGDDADLLSHLELVNSLNAVIDFEPLKVQMDKSQRELISKKVDELRAKKLQGFQFFTVSRFAKTMRVEPRQAGASIAKAVAMGMNLESVVKTNFVLKNYAIDSDAFSKNVLKLIWLQNQGYNEDVAYHTALLDQPEILIEQVIENPADLFLLKMFYKQIQKKAKLSLDDPVNQAVAHALAANLCKNSSALRLQSLRILKTFEVLKYVKPSDPEQEVSENYQDARCECISLMHDFENLELGFETHKAKEHALEALAVVIKSHLVPPLYLEMIYNFLVGCFWLKFTLLFEKVQECIGLVITSLGPSQREHFVLRHVETMQTAAWLSQFEGHENTSLVPQLETASNKTKVDATDFGARAYASEIRVEEQFLETKDFFFQVCRSLGGVLGPCILPQKNLREPLFAMFYDFVDLEYKPLHQQKSAAGGQSLVDRMTYSNMLDSESHKAFRRQAYSTLAGFLDTFKTCGSLRQVPRVGELQSVVFKCLSSTDSKLQKCALEVLTKTGFKAGLMAKYKKLLEGFCDDEKFKDMIPILIHGQETRAAEDVAEEYTRDTDDKAVLKAQRKETKASIPRLEPEDREAMLPVVIKLLQSKLTFKKGAINKKSLHTRRNIVFQFYSTLNPNTEFKIFLDELLEPVNLSTEEISIEAMMQALSSASFNTFLMLIRSMDVLLKQMGTLIKQYLPHLATILVKGLLKLASMFVQSVKEAKDDGDVDMNEAEDDGEQEQKLHHNANRQAKDCLRKGLGLVKDIFRKFCIDQAFTSAFSETVYTEIIAPSMSTFRTHFVSDRSQLIEMMCVNWPDHPHTLANFVRYPEILPNLIAMLSHKAIRIEVAGLHMSMLKKLILDSLDPSDQPNRALRHEIQPELQHIDSCDSSDSDAEMRAAEQELQQELKEQQRQTCVQLLSTHVAVISVAVHAYWDNHAQEIRHSLSTKNAQRSWQQRKQNLATLQQENQQRTEQVKKFQIAKDLLFIQSELSAYLKEDDPINLDFLDMMVQVMAIRNIHNEYLHQDELILFGAKSIVELIPKVPHLSGATLERVFQLFLLLKLKKARAQLSQGLAQVLGGSSKHAGVVSEKSLSLIQSLNKLKRGVADMELDSDSVITSIKQFMAGDAHGQESLLDVFAVAFNIIYLVANEEYSVREYAEHAFRFLLERLKAHERTDQEKLVQLAENQIVGEFLHTVKDEMALKTVLMCLRHLIVFCHEQAIESRHMVKGLVQLCSPKDETADFFANCLSIKLKDRQRSLKMLKTHLDSGDLAAIKTVQHVLMPIVDYLVFGGATQHKSRRDTVSYEKNQKVVTLDEGLAVYTSFSKLLPWGEYFKLLKKLLFKLQLASQHSRSVSAEGQPELQKEKIITKAICKVLEGFHFDEIQDVVHIIAAQHEERQKKREGGHKLWNSDFSDLLQTQMQATEAEPDGDQSEVSEPEEDLAAEAVAEADEQMKGGSPMTMDQKADIQNKLLTKVLPVLEAHLTELGDKHTVRGFVAVCYAKTIRKLPPQKFNQKLHKLLNLIVVQGLRSKDLSHREKARKALVKLVEEISPRFLGLVFDEMKSQLTKGFQQHVYLFSIHSLLAGLVEQGKLEPGSISAHTVDLNMEILLSELFGDLDEEKANDTHERKIIKESKARKAIPIFEILAQFTDFQTGFMHILAPIICTLETSPGFNKIQQCEDLLSRVSSSLLKNQTVKGSQLMLFLFSIIDRGVKLAAKIKINDDKEKRDYGAALDRSIQYRSRAEQREMTFKVEMLWKKGRQTIDRKKTEEISGRVLASFGLQCLKKALKNKEIITVDAQDLKTEEQREEMRARLDPFVILILNSFKTYHNPVVVTALHIMTQIIGLGLPSFKELLKKFLNRFFKLFMQTHSSDSDFLNSLFKCTAELIRTYAIYQDLSEVQVRTLVEIIKTHIDKFSLQTNALQCLRSVVHRRFECADLYDLIEQIQETMVFSTLPSIRALCASILVQFLLDYPLAPERVEQHINFLIKNLSCNKVAGRLQLLDVLKTLFDRLPGAVLDLYCELLFFSLLLRAVNDESTECRAAVQQTMQALVFNPKINQSKMRTLLNTVLRMGSDQPGKREMLQMAKMNAFQMLVQSGNQNSLKLTKHEIGSIVDAVHVDAIKPHLELLNEKLAHRKQLLAKAEESSDETENEDMKNFLKAIDLGDESEEASQAKEEESEPETDQSKPWTLLFHGVSCLEKLLEFQEARTVTAKFIELDLTRTFLVFAQNHSNHWVRLICQRLLGRLFATSLQIKANLLEVLGLQVPEQIEEFTFDLINCLFKPTQSEELRNQLVKNLLFMVQALLDAHSGVNWDKLFRKLSFIGRKMMFDIKTSKDRLETILQFFNLSVQFLLAKSQTKVVQAICAPVLELVYRTYTDEQYERGSVIKDQSIELVELLQSRLDKPFFIETFGAVKTSILQKRSARKAQQRQLVGTEEGLAMRKNKRQKKMEKKKAKKQETILRRKLTK